MCQGGNGCVAKQDPDFIEALARGLDVIQAFEPNRPTMTLSEVATATGLARPTARRMLLTLEELGYVRAAHGGFGAHPASPRTWHGLHWVDQHLGYSTSTMEQLVEHTGESSSLAQRARVRHRLCRSGSCAEDYHPGGDYWHALSGPSDIAWKSAARRTATNELERVLAEPADQASLALAARCGRARPGTG